MEEFCGMEDWGLQAVVRGSSGDYTNIVNTDFDEKSFFGFPDNQQYDHGFAFDFPENFEGVTGSSDELEELYKPFYPVANSLPPQTVLEFKEEIPETVVQEKQVQYGASDTSNSTTRVTGYTPKYKRRKNQHKRVVIQVSADGLSSDVWAWRKYGQKPIKGSPYPRSYYRCSSSKGCLARKQVEQSCTDPGMFIITYTAEHSHSQPTRRNSLAGTIRQKFPASKSTNGSIIKQEKIEDSTSSSRISAPLLVSTKTLLASPMEEDFPQAEMIKQEDEARFVEENSSDHNAVAISELMFGDDFFSGLEELDGFNTELPIGQSSAQQFPVSSCS